MLRVKRTRGVFIISTESSISLGFASVIFMQLDGLLVVKPVSMGCDLPPFKGFPL
jgi:hypothetical protein